MTVDPTLFLNWDKHATQQLISGAAEVSRSPFAVFPADPACPASAQPAEGMCLTAKAGYACTTRTLSHPSLGVNS